MSLHVETVGVGPPLVLLHGWALHSGLWQPIVPHLAQHFRLHLVDLPGHGHSATIEPYTADAIVATLEQFFAGEKKPLNLLGWSLGGLVAMRWASLSISARKRSSCLVRMARSLAMRCSLRHST